MEAFLFVALIALCAIYFISPIGVINSRAAMLDRTPPAIRYVPIVNTIVAFYMKAGIFGAIFVVLRELTLIFTVINFYKDNITRSSVIVFWLFLLCAIVTYITSIWAYANVRVKALGKNVGFWIWAPAIGEYLTSVVIVNTLKQAAKKNKQYGGTNVSRS